MNPARELLAWVRAARGAVRWHLESGDDRLPVGQGFRMPPLGNAVPQSAPPPAARAPAPAPAAPVVLPASERGEALEALRAHVGECTRCPLSGGRQAIVHAVGPTDARLAIVAEAPSSDDEAYREPFRGPAGELLDKMIGAMGLSRAQILLCTVVMCRPPEDREPTANEISACLPFLRKRLEVVRPEVIVAFGEVPMRALVPNAGSILKAHGRWLAWEGIPVMPTYGPTTLLRDAEKKRPAWDDLKKVMSRLGLDAPRK